jgi:hypothetical protein
VPAAVSRTARGRLVYAVAGARAVAWTGGECWSDHAARSSGRLEGAEDAPEVKLG